MCKVADDWSVIEIVQRRQRYTVQRAQVGIMHAVVVSYVEEEETRVEKGVDDGEIHDRD